MKITVFTPVYNRAYIITKLYESLCAQTDKDFEWLVIDDGSTDNIEKLISYFNTRKNGFPIRFYTKTNGGKHTCINMATDLAYGDWFFIVDSDDFITVDAIETIKRWTKGIKQEEKDLVIGVAGQKCYYSNKSNVGTTFDPSNSKVREYEGDMYIDCSSLERKENNISGDKAEVLRTEVIKKYKFPVFEGEKFLTENCIWYPIAADGYKIRWFNKPIYYCEYLDDGLTKTKGGNSKHFYGDVYTAALYAKLNVFSTINKIGAYGRIYKDWKLRGCNKEEFEFVKETCGIGKVSFVICGIMTKIRDLLLKRNKS